MAKTKKSTSKSKKTKTAKTAVKRKVAVKKSKGKKSARKVAVKMPKVKVPKVSVKDFKPEKVAKKLKEFGRKNKGMLTNLGWFLAGAMALMVIDYTVQYMNNDMSVAVVNNSRITRSSFHDRLEERAGEQILEDMIRDQIIYQEATKAGVKVTDEEIQTEYDTSVEMNGGKEQFEQRLAVEGLTEELYKDLIRLELMATRLVVTEPTEEDIMEFFEENKEIYFAGQEAYEDDKDLVEETYYQVMLSTEFPTWMQDVRANTVIQNNLTEKPEYGFFKATKNIFTNIYDEVMNTVETEE